jgi:RHS repeat-associated protein
VSDSSGNITANYYYDNNGQIMAMKKNGNYYYYQFNAHGDVVSLTDESGNIVNSYKYDPWGKLLSISETISNPYRYAGYRYDTDTGLYYLRARYYNPNIMRFMTKDLKAGFLINPQTLNSYVYCNNNPVNLIDPMGEDWTDVGISVVGGIVIGVGLVVEAPELIVIGIGIAAYSGYRSWSAYNSGKISGGDLWTSGTLDAISAIPVVGPGAAVGSICWETVRALTDK